MEMYHVWRKSKLIKVNPLKTFISLIGMGIVFWAMSIPGFASSSTVYVDVNKSFYQSYTSSTVSYDRDKKYGTLVNLSGSSSSYSLGSSSGAIYSSAELYLVTTEGSYLIANGSSNSYTSSLRFVNVANRYFSGYPCGSLLIVRGSVPSGSSYSSSASSSTILDLDIEDLTYTDPATIDLTVVKSNTETIISMLEDIDISTLESLLSDILVKTSAIDSTVSSINLNLIDIESAIGGTNSRLTDILFEIYKLKKSICYDFSDSIDGNYQISTSYFVRSLDYFNNNPLPIGKAAFDIKPSFPSTRFYLRVPSSRKILFYVGLQGGEVNFGAFYDSNGNVISRSVVDNSEQWSYRYIYYTFPDSVSVGTVFYFIPTFTFYSNDSIRFAFYDYVVSANDILDYMKSQWASTQPSTYSLDSNISDTGDMQSDVNVIEDNAFTDFTGAYDHTGIAVFSWTVFSGMSVFSSIVNKFYFAFPSEFSLYITAVLIVGVIAVLISAVGRIIKKGGD